MKKYIFFLVIVGLFSCSTGILKNKQTKDFRFTLNKFKVIDDSFEINSQCIFPEKDIKEAKRIDTENDCDFFKTKESMPVSIGMLPDTSNYYILIYGQAAACYIPQLAVFSKKGKLVDEHPIFYGGGAGCGYRWTSSVQLKSKNKLISKYYEERYECDSLSNPMAGTWNKYEDIYSYSISSKGKIIESKVHNQILKK